MDKRYFESEFETMERDKLDRYQWSQFIQQLERAYRSPFYRKKFDEAGISPADIKSVEDVRRIPYTRKEEVCKDIDDNPPYGSRILVPRDQIVSVLETSGTSGKGKEAHGLSSTDLDRFTKMEATGATWAGISAGTVVGFLLPVTMAAAGTAWFLGLSRLNANFLRIGHLETEEKLRYMQRYQAEVIFGTPTYLLRMEAAAQDMGLRLREDLSSLRSIIIAGESRSAEWLAEREQVWGARLYEQWGCTQGAVTFSCEAGMLPDGKRLGMLHGLPHLVYQEVVDPETGSHVGDGEVGELVITPLGVEGSPLIRFAMGDRVMFKSSENCDCGRAYDGIAAAHISRYDDMIKVKGVNVWPTAVSNVLDQHPEIAEHRVTASVDAGGRETLTIEVEFAEETPNEIKVSLIRDLGEELREVTGVKFSVIEWSGEGKLAAEVLKANNFKALRWRNLREGPKSGAASK